ncbi:hypothetical protein X737_22335 [Mesorhizobium sp. L48C026A00]|nr:hypothetical protein X737_22335 [Mesorhizobium sp. L48C026A00]
MDGAANSHWRRQGEFELLFKKAIGENESCRIAGRCATADQAISGRAGSWNLIRSR